MNEFVQFRSIPSPPVPVPARGDRGAERVWLIALLVLLSGLTAEAQDVAEDPFAGAAVLEREALVRAVLERNPGLESMRSAWLAAGEREARVSSLEDLRVMTSIAPQSARGDERFGYMVQVEQMLPWSGKRGAMGAMERAMAAAMKGDWESGRLEMALMTSMLYDELYSAERMLELNAHHIVLMEEMKESAEAMYVADMASMQDPIEAEVAIARMEAEQASIEAMITVLRARLNALLHRLPDAPLPPLPDTLDLPPHETRDGRALHQTAIASRPEIAVVEARVSAGRAEAELADRERFPDLAVVASYDTTMMDAAYRFQVGLGVNIPNQREKRRAMLREAEMKVEAERSRLEEMQDTVRLEISTALVEIGKARRIHEIYESRLVPAGRDRVAAAHAGFSSGTNDFSAVVTAVNDLRELEIERETTLAQLYTARAKLDRALGRLPFAQQEAGR